MATPKPPQRSMDDADRRIRQFLERAASIVLENPALTTERWQQLSTIATELELSAEQFRMTLDDLILRGLLRRVDTALPKPPPLPRERPALELRAVPPVRPEESNVPSRMNIVPPARVPIAAAKVPADEADKKIEIPSPIDVPPSLPLALSAKEPQRPAQPAPKPNAIEIGTPSSEKASGRWRVEGEPIPIPPRPNKKPHAIFADFVQQSLKYVDGNEISPAIEQRMVHHGTRVLSLSNVYARHLLEQIAAENGFRFAAAHSDSDVSDSSKQLPSAPWDVADASMTAGDSGEVHEAAAGPSDQDSPSSVKTAEKRQVASSRDPKNRSAPKSNYIQLERLVPFRQYLHSALERLPRGLLPLQTLDKMMDAGVDLYGVDSDLVLETIRHVAGEFKIAVVTKQEAEEHVAEFISTLLDLDIELSSSQIEQVRQSGAHWGLNASQIDAVIQRVCNARQSLRRREELTARLALGAAAVAVFLLICFIGYVFINAQSHRGSSSQPSFQSPDSR